MRIVPVLDLMRGVIVRGIAGRRSEYRPIESRLANGSRPMDVARGLARLGPREFYLADLDAIAGAEPAWDVHRDLIREGFQLWIDAGLSNLASASAMVDFAMQHAGLTGIVAGLESLPSPALLKEIIARVGSERLVFSLDLKSGRALTQCPEWSDNDPETIARAVIEMGVRRLIVLDLALVGVGAGTGTEALCKKIRAMDAEVELIAGGGVRGIADLHALAAAGCDAALVASALHDGRITAADLAKL